MHKKDELLLSLCRTGTPTDVLLLLDLFEEFDTNACTKDGKTALECVAGKLIMDKPEWTQVVAPRLLEKGFDPVRKQPEGGKNAMEIAQTTNPPLAKRFGATISSSQEVDHNTFVIQDKREAIEIALKEHPVPKEKLTSLLMLAMSQEMCDILTNAGADPYAFDRSTPSCMTVFTFTPMLERKAISKRWQKECTIEIAADNFVQWASECQSIAKSSTWKYHNLSYKEPRRRSYMTKCSLTPLSKTSTGETILEALANKQEFKRVSGMVREMDTIPEETASSLWRCIFNAAKSSVYINSENTTGIEHLSEFLLTKTSAIPLEIFVNWLEQTDTPHFAAIPAITKKMRSSDERGRLDIPPQTLSDMATALTRNLEEKNIVGGTTNKGAALMNAICAATTNPDIAKVLNQIIEVADEHQRNVIGGLLLLGMVENNRMPVPYMTEIIDKVMEYGGLSHAAFHPTLAYANEHPDMRSEQREYIEKIRVQVEASEMKKQHLGGTHITRSSKTI